MYTRLSHTYHFTMCMGIIHFWLKFDAIIIPDTIIKQNCCQYYYKWLCFYVPACMKACLEMHTQLIDIFGFFVISLCCCSTCV